MDVPSSSSSLNSPFCSPSLSSSSFSSASASSRYFRLGSNLNTLLLKSSKLQISLLKRSKCVKESKDFYNIKIHIYISCNNFDIINTVAFYTNGYLLMVQGLRDL